MGHIPQKCTVWYQQQPVCTIHQTVAIKQIQLRYVIAADFTFISYNPLSVMVVTVVLTVRLIMKMTTTAASSCSGLLMGNTLFFPFLLALTHGRTRKLIPPPCYEGGGGGRNCCNPFPGFLQCYNI